jgi:hypothetical protein
MRVESTILAMVLVGNNTSIIDNESRVHNIGYGFGWEHNTLTIGNES